ncbi:MAG: phenylacetate--CoA ligase family protein [Methanomassiliicoccales archaeon]|nr:MAG: phenylacetate--CoA ligase family protein [Methanomassiliicoccales archaeon]
MGFQAQMLKKFPGIIKYADKESSILRRLKKAVDYAYKSKFYARKLKKAGVKGADIKSIRDFKEKVPQTTRSELVEVDPYDILAVSPGSKCLIYSQTSGTTGGHVPVWVTKDELEKNIDLAVCLPVFQKLLSPKDKVALCYPYTRTLAGRTADLINQKAGVTIIPMGTRNNMYPPLEVADALIRLKPTILGAAATDAFSYANILMDQGIDPKKIGIKLIVSGAEPCADNRGKVLGELYGATFLSLLGQNEIGGAIPCEKNILHLPSFVMFTELYHDDGTEAGFGERANSIVTPTWREAMPLLRYRTGDVVKINKEPCECGLPLPTMEILGRKRTEISIGSKKFFPIELENFLYQSNLNGVWYQIKLAEDSVMISAEHRDKADYPRLANEIKTNLEKELNKKVEVKLGPPGTLYDYRKIRPGKPLSRVVDVKKGKSEVVEGA